MQSAHQEGRMGKPGRQAGRVHPRRWGPSWGAAPWRPRGISLPTGLRSIQQLVPRALYLVCSNANPGGCPPPEPKDPADKKSRAARSTSRPN